MIRIHVASTALLLLSCKPLPSAIEPIEDVIARPAIDDRALDRGVAPCDDFYQFACGGWIAENPVPPDQSAWMRSFSVIHERNQTILRSILEGYAAGATPPGEPHAQALGDFYATCMDEAKAETASLDMLRREMARLRTVTDARTLARLVALYQLQGVRVFFALTSQQDLRDATQVIGAVDQPVFELPRRELYLEETRPAIRARARYLRHIERMLELLGDPPEEVPIEARRVLELEALLARFAMPAEERRDPDNTYHRRDRNGLKAEVSRFDWDAYFEAMGHPEIDSINIAAPNYLAGLNALLAVTSIADLRLYLRFRLLEAAAPSLGAGFVNEEFAFRAATQTGEKQILPRWKRCVDAVEQGMGEALSRPFIKRTFGDDGKERSRAMLVEIERVFEENLGRIAWMDDDTRAHARDKLHLVTNKIGFPDGWRSYDGLILDRSSPLSNQLRAASFNSGNDLERIGKPVDRQRWDLSPLKVDTHYEAARNEMLFPAGILQPPLFYRAGTSTAATNYGAIGMIIGHELTHAFGEEGRHLDGNGNLGEWWSPGVAQRYSERASCAIRQYGQFVSLKRDDYRMNAHLNAVDGDIQHYDLHVDGRLTLIENLADIGGLKLAWLAHRSQRARAHAEPPHIAGFDEDQQFFVSFAQSWCASLRPELLRHVATLDTHAPPRFRVNGPVANLPEFARAFRCKPKSPMVNPQPCGVW